MRRIISLILLCALCLLPCTLSACGGERVTVEEIKIVAPEKIRAGDVFRLEYTTVPEEAAEKVRVDWEIGDPRRLSYEDGEFTALTCGKVTVSAHVRGCEAADEIELTVAVPEGFRRYSAEGYAVVYPSGWTSSAAGRVQTWVAPSGSPNMNVTTEALNATYFTAPAASFQTVLESSYGLMGFTVQFTEPTVVKKQTYLGVSRLQVDYRYTLTLMGNTTSLRQTQLIFNNAEADLSCILTVTFEAETFDDAAAELQKTIFDQFLPE